MRQQKQKVLKIITQLAEPYITRLRETPNVNDKSKQSWRLDYHLDIEKEFPKGKNHKNKQSAIKWTEKCFAFQNQPLAIKTELRSPNQKILLDKMSGPCPHHLIIKDKHTQKQNAKNTFTTYRLNPRIISLILDDLQSIMDTLHKHPETKDLVKGLTLDEKKDLLINIFQNRLVHGRQDLNTFSTLE